MQPGVGFVTTNKHITNTLAPWGRSPRSNINNASAFLGPSEGPGVISGYKLLILLILL